MKQLGARPHSGNAEHGFALCTDSRSVWTFDDPQPDAPPLTYEIFDRSGGDMLEWPPDLRVREAAP